MKTVKQITISILTVPMLIGCGQSQTSTPVETKSTDTVSSKTSAQPASPIVPKPTYVVPTKTLVYWNGKLGEDSTLIPGTKGISETKYYKTSNDVYNDVIASYDDFAKTKSLKGPVINNSIIDNYYFIRSTSKGSTIGLMQVYVSEAGEKGYLRAVDKEGDSLNFINISNDGPEWGTQQHFAVEFNYDYLNARRKAGLAFRNYTNKEGEHLDIEIPGFYIDGFLRKLDQELEGDGK